MASCTQCRAGLRVERRRARVSARRRPASSVASSRRFGARFSQPQRRHVAAMLSSRDRDYGCRAARSAASSARASIPPRVSTGEASAAAPGRSTPARARRGCCFRLGFGRLGPAAADFPAYGGLLVVRLRGLSSPPSRRRYGLRAPMIKARPGGQHAAAGGCAASATVAPGSAPGRRRRLAVLRRRETADGPPRLLRRGGAKLRVTGAIASAPPAASPSAGPFGAGGVAVKPGRGLGAPGARSWTRNCPSIILSAASPRRCSPANSAPRAAPRDRPRASRHDNRLARLGSPNAS